MPHPKNPLNLLRLNVDYCFVPYKCKCGCGNYIKLNPNNLARYEAKINKYPMYISGHYFKTIEYRNAQTRRMKGNKILKGFKFSEESKKNLSAIQKILSNKPKRKEIFSGRLMGNKFNFKGRNTLLYQKIKSSKYYKDWRKYIFKRDSFLCQECNSKENIEAHHIIGFMYILRKFNIRTIEEAHSCNILWDLNNGQTLCKECHKKTYNYRNKNSKQIDVRK